MIFDYLAAVPLRLPASAQGPQPLAGTLASPTQAGPALEPIVGRTAERPFSARLPHPAQQELPIAAALLDLAEHRLDNRFAPSIAPSSARRAEGAAHPIGHRVSMGVDAERGVGLQVFFGSGPIESAPHSS